MESLPSSATPFSRRNEFMALPPQLPSCGSASLAPSRAGFAVSDLSSLAFVLNDAAALASTVCAHR